MSTPNLEDYCPKQDWTPDGARYYRCSACNKRMLPKAKYCVGGEFVGWKLPLHKPKGHKIKKLKAKQHAMRRKK